jgi:predicted short-subunit dehydrogenase-like oxidoreductase (DUF2520 family)
MTKSLAILGAGRVGRALGRRLREAGWRVIVVASRGEVSAKSAARFIGAGRPTAGIPASLIGAGVILLTVPDDAVATGAAELAVRAGKELQDKIVLHTSGALDSSVLEPLRAKGAAVGSMHPLQTFSGVVVPPLIGKVFAIEGDAAAVRAARRIARTLDAVPVAISPAQKPLYHAAGVFAAGMCLALEEAGVQAMMSAGLKRREAQSALLALTRQVLEHYEKLGPQKAWTGPLARGDFRIVAAHENALREMQPEFLDAYHAVNRLGARVLAREPEPMLLQLATISKDAQLSPHAITKAKGGYE